MRAWCLWKIEAAAVSAIGFAFVAFQILNAYALLYV